MLRFGVKNPRWFTLCSACTYTCTVTQENLSLRLKNLVMSITRRPVIRRLYSPFRSSRSRLILIGYALCADNIKLNRQPHVLYNHTTTLCIHATYAPPYSSHIKLPVYILVNNTWNRHRTDLPSLKPRPHPFRCSIIRIMHRLVVPCP
jgi:hypothetical protein